LLLLSLSTAVVVAGVSLIGLGMHNDGSAAVRRPVAGALGQVPNPGVAPAAITAGPDPAEVARKDRARKVKALDAALKKYAASVPEFSVAVLDRKTGAVYSYRGKEKYETASIVKVQVLACILLRAQDKGRGLTANELSLAKRMIRLSDNDATTTLYGQLGRIGGLSSCNKRLGLTSTVVNSSWGLTRTTVDDQVKLLSELVDKKGPLDAGSREVAFTLMTTVDAAQDWGVGAPAKAAEKVAIKNGWLSRSTEANRWIINSVGRISGGADVSIAVLSHNHNTMNGGISVVEKVAKLTRTHLKY
jgi:beta-lactamase class A